MEEPESSSRVLPGRSCIACRRRKIRCDREQPCSYCTKLRLQCIYPGSRPVEKDRSVDNVGARLQRIELVLDRLESKVSPSGSASPQATGAGHSPHGTHQDDASVSQSTSVVGSGKLVYGEGDERYVTSSFWTDLDEAEKEESRSSKQTLSTPSPIPITTTVVRQGCQSTAATSPEIASIDLRQYHPSAEHLFTYWQLFVESVDPVLKILHIPTVQRQFVWASQHITAIPPAFECLMFSIYFAAVTCVQPSTDCQRIFQEDQQTLLRRYRLGVEQALAKANYMSSPDVTTIQALVLFLVCARLSVDKGQVWAMVGLLIRLGMKLGLHHDPSDLGLSPFMSEMRRRLWWQIYVLDVRTAEDSDALPFICEHIYNTKFPANINDVDLDIDMTQPVVSVDRRTEMLFTLQRIQITYVARKIVFPLDLATAGKKARGPSLQDKNKMLQDLVMNMQETCFRYCDPQVPICFLTKTAAEMVITKVKLAMNHPARSNSSKLSPEILEELVLDSIKIIEGTHILRTHDKYSRWVWLFEKYVDWDAVAFLLHIISAMPMVVPLERAWSVINVFFDDWSGRSADLERWRQLEALRNKAVARQNVQDWPTSAPVGHTISPTSVDSNVVNAVQDSYSRQEPGGSNFSSDPHYSVVSNPPAYQLSGTTTFPSGMEEGVNWDFDNFSLVQGMPSWDMEFDDNAFRFNGVG